MYEEVETNDTGGLPTVQWEQDPPSVLVPLTAAYGVLLVAGVVGNVSTCVVIARNRHLHTATNYYLFSLAVSDLLLLVSGVPQELYSMWSPYQLGEAVCVLQGFAAETSANATVLTVTAFTVERYVAICHPFMARGLSQLSRAVKLVLLIWLAALCFAVPQAIQFGVVEGRGLCTVKWTAVMEHSFFVSTGVFFVLPMSVITVLYVLIGLKLRRSPSGAKRPSLDSSRPTTSVASQQSYVIRMLVAVVVAFFICWAPFHAQRLLAIYAMHSETLQKSESFLKGYNVLTYMSGVLYYLGTTINPLLYNIMSHKFREAFKKTLSQLCDSHSKQFRRRTYSIVSPYRQQLPSNQQAAVSIHLSLPHLQPTCQPVLTHNRHYSDTVFEEVALLQGQGHYRPRGASNSSQVTVTTSLGKISLSEEEQHKRPSELNGYHGYHCPHKLDLISEHCSKTSSSSEYKTAEQTSESKQAKTSYSIGCLSKKLREFPETTRTVFKQNTDEAKTNKNIQCDNKENKRPKLNTHSSIDSAKSTISNSSLQDMDEMEFESAELAHYMGELNQQQLSR